MQEGSLRVDANVNLHIPQADGSKIATPIVEIKNMNSFRAVERALAYEAERQFEVWKETGQKIGDVPKQTRGWDDQANITRGQRHKEESSDYRYFPEPDLAPVTVSVAEVEQVRASLGELPAALRKRLESTYGITPYDSDVLVNQGQPLVDYYLALAEKSGDGKQASNWIQQDVLRVLGESGQTIEQYPVPVERLAALLVKVKAGELDTGRGREVLARMLETGEAAEAAMQALGIAAVDESVLVELCKELVAANPKIVADVKSGKQQAAAGLIGQAKKRNANVDPARVKAICIELIEAL
jgi:aspartyl-tRNA(Asn)/glutamyl-tRNA(Gln) amidotransferase subunit B